MPKSFNQKLKILYLMQVFMEKTDCEHPMSVPDLIQYLDGYGISVERKTVYDDIETLRIFGMKIENRREKPVIIWQTGSFRFRSLRFLWMRYSRHVLLQSGSPGSWYASWNT